MIDKFLISQTKFKEAINLAKSFQRRPYKHKPGGVDWVISRPELPGLE